jgi:glycosyltransferase involved in cell wall biosynthesis
MVATPVGGLAEQLTPHGAGLVAADLSPAAFADCMNRLVTESGLYRAMAAAALQAANGPFAWRTIAAAFAAL